MGIAVSAAFALAGVIVAYCASFLLGYARRAVLLSRLPHPGSQPAIMGSTAEMLKPDQHLTLRKWGRELGGIYTFRLMLAHVWSARPWEFNIHDSRSILISA
jgi:hypothetical protein